MNIVLNDSKSWQEKCPLNEALLLLCLYYDAFNDSIIEKAVNDGYLTYNSTSFTKDCTKFVLTKEGSNKIESILLNSEIKETNNNGDRFVILANKLREIYPNGRKPGTAYQWRDSTAVISLRLKALVKKYPDCLKDVSDEAIISATKKYVSSFNGNYTYMQLLKYFIMKNNLADRAEDSSQLLSYIENSGQDGNTTFNDDIGELV